MRAVIVEHFDEQPRLAEVATPHPGSDEILLKVLAAGVNPMDIAITHGLFQAVLPATFPLILGSDVVGEVVGVGTDVAGFAVGDRVFGQLLVPPLGSAGAFADYVAVPAKSPLSIVPRELDAVTAAALPTPGVTALQIADDLADVEGKLVLIVGAGGGVGSYLTQVLAGRGARIIANVQNKDVDRLFGYGAIETVDHTSAVLASAVALAHPEGLDCLVDLADDAPGFADLADLVKAGGFAVSTRYVADLDALERRGVRGINFEVHATVEDFDALAQAVVDGRIVTPPLHEVRIEELPGLFADAGSAGKTVVRLAPAAPVTVHAPPSAERAETLVRRLFDAINAGDDAALDDILSPAFLSYDRAGLRTATAFKRYLAQLRAAFGDLHFQVHENVGVLVEQDKVALRTVVTGTHEGEFFGVAPTHRPIHTSISHLFRVEGDRFVEHWQVVDLYRIFVRIGLLDGAAAAFQRQLGVPESPDGIFVETLGTDFAAARSGRPATTEESRYLARRIFDGVINTGQAEAAGPIATGYLQNTGWTPNGREHFVDGWVAGRAAMPDGVAVQTHVVAENDRVATISVWNGTVANTGVPVDFMSADFLRIEDGQAAEHWDTVEYTRLYAALGLVGEISARPVI